ncbi:MAG: RNA polymerase sigma factor [Prolixibacteraceae bacterium]|nr:RNA polymerase sigma factor [Prolixibacteraceae bacterium]
MYTALEDFDKLIQDCVAGKQQAQARLYHIFSPKMYGVCLRYAKDASEAEDSLQEGFLKVFTNIKSFRNEGSLEGWIRRIMVNVSLEKYRKQHFLYPVEDVSLYDREYHSGDVISNISANDLLNMIQELPPRYRMVFNLYVMEGMPHQEIAKEMNITEGTSKSNLARARGILQEKVNQRFGEHKVKTNTKA